MNKTVAIIGAGRVGGAIGHLLAKAGFTVIAVVCRTEAPAEKARVFIGSGSASTDPIQAAGTADIVFITTPDGAIRQVCERISQGRGFKPGSMVIHTSGAHTLDLLDSAKKSGVHRAVIHPLQSLPGMEQGAKNLPGSFFRIEADPEMLQAAKDIVAALGGIELVMPKWRSDKQSAALYHAGAVAVSNYFVALIDYGLRFYQDLGADKQQALQAVLPLIKGTLANMEAMGTTQALTGPIARGDAETVKGHIQAMEERLPELLPLYRELAKQTIQIAGERGLDDKKVEELLKIVK
ncbi:MAG: DUF2520 domain-containing protein [Nitrospirota bacterium]|nr:DUF2520 domain-containing protein [Nitrospirota bacterium]